MHELTCGVEVEYRRGEIDREPEGHTERQRERHVGETESRVAPGGNHTAMDPGQICQIWHQSGLDRPQMGQIRGFFRSDSVHFGSHKI